MQVCFGNKCCFLPYLLKFLEEWKVKGKQGASTQTGAAAAAAHGQLVLQLHRMASAPETAEKFVFKE